MKFEHVKPEQFGRRAQPDQPAEPNSHARGISAVVDYLTSVPAWYLATVEGDKPHVRPFSFACELDGRLCFCTAAHKDVYREMQTNPNVELSAWKPGCGWLIARGQADFSLNPADGIRQAGYEHLSALGEHYDGPHDARLAFFTLAHAEACIYDIDGAQIILL